MKLEKAIEIITLVKTCDFEGETSDLEDALQLGIGAVERVIRHREMHLDGSRPLLPGETNGEGEEPE